MLPDVLVLSVPSYPFKLKDLESVNGKFIRLMEEKILVFDVLKWVIRGVKWVPGRFF